MVEAPGSTGNCPLESSCHFATAVARNPVLKVKYAALHRYCRGGDSAECSRLRAIGSSGTPARSLLPDGTVDASIMGRAHRVLVVDDIPVFRKLMEGIVAGFVDEVEILSAQGGREALAVLSRNDVDLVVTDFNMPDINGGELIKEMRKPSPMQQVPVVVFTTESSQSLRDEALGYGRVRWVAKSPERFEFARAVDDLMIRGLA